MPCPVAHSADLTADGFHVRHNVVQPWLTLIEHWTRCMAFFPRAPAVYDLKLDGLNATEQGQRRRLQQVEVEALHIEFQQVAEMGSSDE